MKLQFFDVMIIIFCDRQYFRFGQISIVKSSFWAFMQHWKGSNAKSMKWIVCLTDHKMLFIVSYHYLPRNAIWVLHAFATGYSFPVSHITSETCESVTSATLGLVSLSCPSHSCPVAWLLSPQSISFPEGCSPLSNICQREGGEGGSRPALLSCSEDVHGLLT